MVKKKKVIVKKPGLKVQAVKKGKNIVDLEVKLSPAKQKKKAKRKPVSKRNEDVYLDIAALKKIEKIVKKPKKKKRKAKRTAKTAKKKVKKIQKVQPKPARKREKRKVKRHMAIAAFLFNLLLPGFGSIIGGAKRGVQQLLLWGFSWIVGIFLSMAGSETAVYLGYILGFGGATIAWVWALGSSIKLLSDSEKL